MSDTPRTNEEENEVARVKGWSGYVRAGHARQLERELAEAHRTMEYIGTLEYLERLEKAEKAAQSASGAPKIPKFAAELWDEGEYVITVNGTPWGSTVPKHAAGEIARWLTHNFVRLVASTDSGGN